MTTAWLVSEKLCFLRKGLRVRLSSGVCFLTLVWIAGSLTLVGTTARAVPLPQEQKQAPAVTPAEKTAAEAFKNIQVLKEIPESKLIPAMFFISASLGVGCDHCHVTSDHGPWPLEKDDKDKKKTAREMIKMMRAINEQNFDGRTEVTCATCHHGLADPMSVPPIPALGARSNEGGENDAPKTLPPADEILDKYVKAIGGAAALEKLITRQTKGAVITESGKSYSLEILQKAPDHYSMVIGFPPSPVSLGYDGKIAWQKWPNGVFTQSGIEGSKIARTGEFFVDTNVKARYARRVVVGKEKWGEKEVYVIRAVGKGDVSERLYFDVSSGLLLCRMVMTRTALGLFPEQVEYDDYREVDGVKLPFTVRRMEINTRWTQKYTEIKHNVAVDDARFAKPEPPK